MFEMRRCLNRSSAQLGVLATVLLAACGTGPDNPSAAVVRDSSGVRIVESTAGTWKPGEEWSVDVHPSLEVGQFDSEPAYQFFRVSGVDLLSDGSIVVLDGGSAQLRRYTPEGRHLWSAGARGSGPGEFQQPMYLGRYRDGSFALWDRRISRLTVIDANGTIARTENFVGGEALPTAFGLFSDGAPRDLPKCDHATGARHCPRGHDRPLADPGRPTRVGCSSPDSPGRGGSGPVNSSYPCRSRQQDSVYPQASDSSPLPETCRSSGSTGPTADLPPATPYCVPPW